MESSYLGRGHIATEAQKGPTAVLHTHNALILDFTCFLFAFLFCIKTTILLLIDTQWPLYSVHLASTRYLIKWLVSLCIYNMFLCKNTLWGSLHSDPNILWFPVNTWCDAHSASSSRWLQAARHPAPTCVWVTSSSPSRESPPKSCFTLKPRTGSRSAPAGSVSPSTGQVHKQKHTLTHWKPAHSVMKYNTSDGCGFSPDFKFGGHMFLLLMLLSCHWMSWMFTIDSYEVPKLVNLEKTELRHCLKITWNLQPTVTWNIISSSQPVLLRSGHSQSFSHRVLNMYRQKKNECHLSNVVTASSSVVQNTFHFNIYAYIIHKYSIKHNICSNTYTLQNLEYIMKKKKWYKCIYNISIKIHSYVCTTKTSLEMWFIHLQTYIHI